LAAVRPNLSNGSLPYEPNEPPIHENVAKGAPDWFEDGPKTRPWGITRGTMTYDPAIQSAEDLTLERQDEPDGPGLVRCWLQEEPARRMPRLAGIPILIVTSESSYHAPYDHCTAKWLDQAGVKHTFVRLPSVGIRGNGHMMMLEKNNLEIAAFLRKWEQENVK